MSDNDPGAPMPDIDPRWEAYAAGTLSDAERAELDAWADRDPFAAACREAFRPMSEAFEAQIADHAAASLRPRRSAWRWAAGAVVVAMAAALLLWVRTPPDPSHDVVWDSVRSEPGARVPRFGSGDAVAVAMVPRREFPGVVQVAVFVDRWAEDARLSVTPEVSDAGWIHLSGTMGTPPWDVTPGSHTLVVVAGPVDQPVPQGPEGHPWERWDLEFDVVR